MNKQIEVGSVNNQCYSIQNIQNGSKKTTIYQDRFDEIEIDYAIDLKKNSLNYVIQDLSNEHNEFNATRAHRIIQKINRVKGLARFIQTPILDHKILIALNPSHYKCAYKRIYNILSNDGQDPVNSFPHRDSLNQITRLMVEKLNHCEIDIDDSSRIISYFGKLYYKYPEGEKWLLEKLEKGIPNANEYHLFMMLSAGMWFFSEENHLTLIRKIIEHHEPKLRKSDILLLTGLIAAISQKAFNEEFKQLKYELISIIKARSNELSERHILYLMRKGSPTLSLLRFLEDKLTERGMSGHAKILAYYSLAKQGHESSRMTSAGILKLLASDRITVSDKVSLLHAVAILGKIDHVFVEKFRELLISLKNDEYKKLKTFVQIKLILTSAIFFDSNSCPEIIHEIAGQIQTELLLKQDVTAISDALFALGIKRDFGNLPKVQVKSSLTEFMVTEYLKNAFLQRKIFSGVRIESECETKRRKADIVIKFENSGIIHKPIAIEIDGKSHYRDGDSSTPLGKDFIRDKMHSNAGFEVWSFRYSLSGDIETDCKKLAEEIIERLEKIIRNSSDGIRKHDEKLSLENQQISKLALEQAQSEESFFNAKKLLQISFVVISILMLMNFATSSNDP